jgi:hypothetical protein
MKRSCKKARNNIMPLLTGQLAEERAREVKEHLAGCPLCSREAADLGAAWETLGTALPEEHFKDIAPGVLATIKSTEHRDNLLYKFMNLLFRTPALGTLIALLALPTGIYLGKNLYLNTAYALNPEEVVAAPAEALPLDIFNDFPDDSIGSVYVNLGEEAYQNTTPEAY